MNQLVANLALMQPGLTIFYLTDSISLSRVTLANPPRLCFGMRNSVGVFLSNGNVA